MWKLTYKWARFTYPHKGETLDRFPILWRVQLLPAIPLDVRRPRKRCLPGQIRLDEDHPAHPGQRLGVSGRPGPDRLLDGPAPTRDTPLDRTRSRLLHRQRGRCPLCGQFLLHTDVEPLHPDEWQRWITATAKAIRHHAIIVDSGPESLGYIAFRLIHTHCQRLLPDGSAGAPALCSPDYRLGLA